MHGFSDPTDDKHRESQEQALRLDTSSAEQPGNGWASRRVSPVLVSNHRRIPARRWSSTPLLLLGVFLALNLLGGILLASPMATAHGDSAGYRIAFFTAVSASTVTGLTVVDTVEFWSHAGEAIIFALMLLGGLEFITAATALINVIGRRATVVEEDVSRDTVGTVSVRSLAGVARNIMVAFSVIYLIGAALLFIEIRTIPGFSPGEAAWQSIFLSVSALNSAGFSILPNSPGGDNTATLGAHPFLMWVMTPLIILGALGWPYIMDMYRNRTRRFSPRQWRGVFLFNFTRLTADTKLVLITTTGLYIFATLAFLWSEWDGVLSGHSALGAIGLAAFHGVSGRTAGMPALDWTATRDITQEIFVFLMFIGGSTASVASGIKVNTLAVLAVAVRSSLLRNPRVEIFRRELGSALVARAILLGLLSFVFIAVALPVMTLTDPQVPVNDLLFEIVSAFGTNGLSTGVSGDISLGGDIILMVTMVVGRIGPLSLVMMLTPRDTASYRYPREAIRIG